MPQIEISHEWFRLFYFCMIHIGKLIEEELHRQERSVSWFAKKTLLRTDKCVFHLQAYQYRHRPTAAHFHRAATQFLSTLPHRIRPETGQLSPGLIKKSVIFLQHIRELYYHSKMICKHLPPYLCRKNK